MEDVLLEELEITNCVRSLSGGTGLVPPPSESNRRPRTCAISTNACGT